MIADKVILPKGLKPGKYILGWRNGKRSRSLCVVSGAQRSGCTDCEETAQVWQNCADVKIVA